MHYKITTSDLTKEKAFRGGPDEKTTTKTNQTRRINFSFGIRHGSPVWISVSVNLRLRSPSALESLSSSRTHCLTLGQSICMYVYVYFYLLIMFRNCYYKTKVFVGKATNHSCLWVNTSVFLGPWCDPSLHRRLCQPSKLLTRLVDSWVYTFVHKTYCLTHMRTHTELRKRYYRWSRPSVFYSTVNFFFFVYINNKSLSLPLSPTGSITLSLNLAK